MKRRNIVSGIVLAILAPVMIAQTIMYPANRTVFTDTDTLQAKFDDRCHHVIWLHKGVAEAYSVTAVGGGYTIQDADEDDFTEFNDVGNVIAWIGPGLEFRITGVTSGELWKVTFNATVDFPAGVSHRYDVRFAQDTTATLTAADEISTTRNGTIRMDDATSDLHVGITYVDFLEVTTDDYVGVLTFNNWGGTMVFQTMRVEFEQLTGCGFELPGP